MEIGVAWELGQQYSLASRVTELCVGCGVDKKHQLVDDFFQPIEESAMALIPPGLFGELMGVNRERGGDKATDLFSSLENIKRIRAALLDKIFQCLREVIFTLHAQIRAGSVRQPKSVAISTEAYLVRMLGSIISSLDNLELQIVWDSNTDIGAMYQRSVNNLVRVLKTIKVVGVDGQGQDLNPIPGLLKKTKDLLASRESPLTAEHISYLEKQEAMLKGQGR
jgi:hypothetical protein